MQACRYNEVSKRKQKACHTKPQKIVIQYYHPKKSKHYLHNMFSKRALGTSAETELKHVISVTKPIPILN